MLCTKSKKSYYPTLVAFLCKCAEIMTTTVHSIILWTLPSSEMNACVVTLVEPEKIFTPCTYCYIEIPNL